MYFCNKHCTCHRPWFLIFYFRRLSNQHRNITKKRRVFRALLYKAFLSLTCEVSFILIGINCVKVLVFQYLDANSCIHFMKIFFYFKIIISILLSHFFPFESFIWETIFLRNLVLLATSWRRFFGDRGRKTIRSQSSLVLQTSVKLDQWRNNTSGTILLF